MTFSDPSAPHYTDQADVRNELTRTFDVCQSCRRCTDLCAAFPTLFALLERHPDRDAGRLTPADQDQVVDLCHQCKLCSIDCPHGPMLEQPGVDVPRLMLRATAMQRANNLVSVRRRVVPVVVARSGVVGTLASPIAARVARAQPGSLLRRVARRASGVSAERVVPPVARTRFSTWFRKRPPVAIEAPSGTVAVFPSCLVEHSDPTIGHDLVKVYERNGIACTVPDVGCCGAPLLHAGDTKRFAATAAKIVRRLASEVRSGSDIVVPQPACHHVLRHDYREHLPAGDRLVDAELVAASTYDAAEYLVLVERASDRSLDTDFSGPVPADITCHAPCHLRASGLGLASSDLMRLTGARVTTVEQCSGVAGVWGLRADHAEASSHIGARLSDMVDRTPGDVVVGACHLANTAIASGTGRPSQHPLQVLARAYGIEPES